VAYRISLMPAAIEGHLDEWRSTLQSAACEHAFDLKYPEVTGPKVISFLLFDDDNPSSVKSCLRTARNNGRAVRTALTRDVWESLNSTWNEFFQIKPSNITTDRLPGFLEWIRQRSMMFRGALLGTMLRTDNYFFSQLGNFIERADNTARILDVKYYILLPRPGDVGSEIDMQQWAQVLRSVSAHRAYRWFYRDSLYRPWLVAEFLILRDQLPRSLVFSYQWINNAMDGLATLYDCRYPCHDKAAETLRFLKNSSMDEIFQQGLHEFLQDFMKSNAELSRMIGQTYNFP
jgi:uncharacterized alpha-E superfamily protein